MELTFKLQELDMVAKKILDNSPSKILAFYGDMGAGKTTLIKALLRVLGARDSGSSPTFGIVNEYHDANEQLLAFHFDFYRLNDETEALDFGLEEYLAQDAYVFLEWPEKVASLLPGDMAKVHIEILGPGSRRLHL